ncbi:putative lipoprotein [Hyphomonas johnsonii MHS-2]|uniref:Putative lipoprotein n=2 Tax=Hyphomonas johnsonii TaxID=81031 RepID=A0A059FS50_9PROT|nr:putative lipoprotein [Hyphomonas johnsonii MHS-2]
MPAEAMPSREAGNVAVAFSGEGGEGEGGVSVTAAATDAVVYNSALAIAEAHVVAARDAYIAGEHEAAGEMFAHPVSEVLFDLQPVLTAQGVDDFSDLLLDASAAALSGASVEEIAAHTDRIIAALRDASTKAPDDESSSAFVAAGVCADQIERAADMYRIAATSDHYEPYLDGYGFYKAARAAFERSEAAIRSENPDAGVSIEAALHLLAGAYPSALRPSALDADQSALTVAASNVVLSTGDK